MATRSLGTLTLDLVAKIGGFEQGMGKAEKRTQQWQREVKKNVEAAGKAFAAGASVAAGALAIMTTRVINNAREIENFSQVANTGTADFQKFAFAAQRVGIEQDKLADILKDTTDRVGDFLQTGAGPMADFFENIAPQVGVTAEEFRNLSGADALGLYVDSLEKANVNQSEMTFFMEAIASDATLLLPLLRNNGKELREFGRQAEEVGAVLSDLELKQLADIKNNIDDLKVSFDGLQNEIVLGAVPAIKEFTDLAADQNTQEAVRDLASAVASIGVGAANATIEFANLGKQIAANAAALTGNLTEVDRLEQELRDIERGLRGGFSTPLKFIGTSDEELLRLRDETQKRLNELSPAEIVIEGDLLGDDFRSVISEVDRDLQKNREEVKAASDDWNDFLQVIGEVEEELSAEAIERRAKAQEAYNALVGDLLTDEERLTQQVRDRLAVLDAIKDLSDEDRQSALGRIAGAATADAPEFSGGDTSAAQVELEDWYQTQLDMLDRFRQDRADLNATWNEEEAAIEQEYQDRLTEISNANEEMRREQMLEGYSALLDVAGQFYQGMEGEEAAYARAAIALGQTLLDEKKRNALTSIISSTNTAAMGAYEALASIPYVGPFLGAAAAAGIYVVGGAAAANVVGLAHDGIDSIPQDGTWLLEEGERVTTADTSAKLDRTLDQVQQNQIGGGVRIVNAWDTQLIGDYMGSDSGEEVIMNTVRRNQSTIRSIVNR
jgi:hypothetical protein